MKREHSNQYFAEAQKLFPGGVNSPVRAFKAGGAYLHDVDGNRYIDYVLSWGPMILGHAPKDVLPAVEEAIWEGTSFGAPSPREIALGQLVQERLPFMERMRMVNSGT